MCRWIALLSSEEVNLSDLVLKAENSLVKMSFNAGYHPGFGPTNNSLFNGDGFGVGWYHGSSISPAVFRDVLPAWSDSNLLEVCNACRSRCIIAHVRAASPGSVVSRENCHPFKCGSLLFCHNGRIDGFWRLRKTLLYDLTENAFLFVRGTTDSECAFAMIISELDSDGGESPFTLKQPYEPERLVNAVRKVIEKLERYQKELDIPRDQCRGFSTLNFSLTDGTTMVVSRYCDQHPIIPAPSLYFAFDNAKKLQEGITRGVGLSKENHVGPGDGSENVGAPPAGLGKAAFADMVDQGMKQATKMKHAKSFADFEAISNRYKHDPSINTKDMACCFSSDPLTFCCNTWVPIPANTIMYYQVGKFPELIVLKEGADLVL